MRNTLNVVLLKFCKDTFGTHNWGQLRLIFGLPE